MILGDLLIEVAINADYMDITNHYNGEPEETLRLPKEVLNTMWQEAHDESSIDWLIDRVIDDYKQDEDYLTAEQWDKLTEWLYKTVDAIELTDGRYEIILFE